MTSVLLLGMIGPWQIVLIVLVFLLMFGGKKIPELMKGLGKGVKEFKDASAKPEEPCARTLLRGSLSTKGLRKNLSIDS